MAHSLEITIHIAGVSSVFETNQFYGFKVQRKGYINCKL